MRYGLLIVSLVGWMPWASAELVIETGSPVHVGYLTEELAAQVGEVEGLSADTQQHPGMTVLTIRRTTGDFTDEERLTLQQVVSGHNAEASSKRREANRKSAKQRLKAKGYTDSDLEDLHLLVGGH